MQKLLKRTSQVQKQAARRQRITRSKNASDTRKLQHDQLKIHNQARRDFFVSARQAQREDWRLGPLAPRRNVGDKVETYGTVPLRLINSPEKMDGKWKDWGIREGDRVCVVGDRKRDKGKIGVVKELNEKAETCKVTGLNMISIATPEYLKTEDRPQPPVQTIEAPLPLSSVRLVTPVKDPYTGNIRDVIVNKISVEKPHRYIANYIQPQKFKNSRAKRHLIPWPKKEKPQFEDHDDDTLRIDVEQETWVPTLLKTPMPSAVIDELRNKYSKFRTRHEDSYVEMKEDMDRKTKERESELRWGGGTPRAMLTPVQELNRQRRIERKGVEEENKLTEEVLAGIGETMARKGKRLPLRDAEMDQPKVGLEATEQGR
ncbi:MAG: hypothetical protein Q9226_005598 [Calogaya cf. arnoldii]